MADKSLETLSDHLLKDSDLEEISSGRIAVKKFKCSRCGKNAMIVKYKKFVCTECKFERPM
ncbi:MAG: hypothetical protein Q4F31_09990 [Eubacteriales bacterium]|nr:hypothetical protein [Eubacteriales bacterium]